MEAAVQLQQVAEQHLEMMEGLPWSNFTFDEQKWENYKLKQIKKSLLIEIFVQKVP